MRFCFSLFVRCLLASLLSGAPMVYGQISQKPVPDPSASRREVRVTARNVAAELQAPLSSAELVIALQVHTGTLPCELGQTVVLTAEPAAAGFFTLVLGKSRYRVAPQETSTGAVRLEDKAAGIVWLQLANKSMLMDQKLGRRLADECKSPVQAQIAQAMLANPPPSILDAVPEPPAQKPVVD